MFKIFKNPFFIYVFGFTLTFLVYSLGWSSIYPELSLEMKMFFSITFLCIVFFGILISILKLIKKTPARTKVKLISKFFYLILFLYTVEFFYEKDIPLLAKLLGRPGVDYDEFGIPLLHGILISFNSFLIAHTFSMYMSTKNKKTLIYYILLFVPALLIINRSIIVFGLLSSLFIYIHYSKKIKPWTQLKIIALGLIALFLFGIVGNLRSGGDYIYTQSNATKEYMNSSIPKEYYWTYLYVASPLANFQNTVNKKNIKEIDFTGFIFYENLPKIISKNLGEVFGIERKDLKRIVPWLTVGTTYARSYAYIGWYGPYLLFLFNLCLYIVVLILVPRKSSYHITTISILSVIILLNIFTNMLIVTGISFQLFYCIIFSFFENKKFIIRKQD